MTVAPATGEPIATVPLTTVDWPEQSVPGAVNICRMIGFVWMTELTV